MAFKQLIRNQNFITGFLIGITLTLGRAWIPFIEWVFRPLFALWSKVWPVGLATEILPLYISGLVIFILIRLLPPKMRNYSSLTSALKFFSLGFLIAFAIFILLAFIAISQFEFAQ